MKITKSQLKRIIKEELESTVQEGGAMRHMPLDTEDNIIRASNALKAAVRSFEKLKVDSGDKEAYANLSAAVEIAKRMLSRVDI